MGAIYNTRFKLTAEPRGNRWRKIYQGKLYYVGAGHCRGKNDRDGYKVAWDEWLALKATIEDQCDRQSYDIVRDTPRIETDLTKARALLANLNPQMARRILAGMAAHREERARILEKFEGPRRGPRTVQGQIDHFLGIKRNRRLVGAISRQLFA
jgi:hypothetical protein